MKMPESYEEFRELELRQKEKLDALRKTLQQAQIQFDRACNEYGDWARECRKKGYT